jgi:hypothetical protein
MRERGGAVVGLTLAADFFFAIAECGQNGVTHASERKNLGVTVEHQVLHSDNRHMNASPATGQQTATRQTWAFLLPSWLWRTVLAAAALMGIPTLGIWIHHVRSENASFSDSAFQFITTFACWRNLVLVWLLIAATVWLIIIRSSRPSNKS